MGLLLAKNQKSVHWTYTTKQPAAQIYNAGKEERALLG